MGDTGKQTSEGSKVEVLGGRLDGLRGTITRVWLDGSIWASMEKPPIDLADEFMFLDVEEVGENILPLRRGQFRVLG